RGRAGEGVPVTGWGREIEPYLESHRVSVAPLRYGAGMKGKIGEALAHGLPVVTTSIGAEGMDAAGALLVADDARGLASKIVRVYREDELWAGLSASGRQRVESRWSAAAVGAQLDARIEAEVAKTAAGELTSIVVLVRDQPGLTEACLESIEAHTPEPHEVILVDNDSGAETAELLERWTREHANASLIRNRDNR